MGGVHWGGGYKGKIHLRDDDGDDDDDDDDEKVRRLALRVAKAEEGVSIVRDPVVEEVK